ncbi:DNA cytosine methyltransferase [Phocaeicola faecalis]
MVQPGCEITVESQASLFEATDKETLLEQEYVIETVCSDLEREGYSVQPILIPACGIGAPHRRDRVWFIAYSESSGSNRTPYGTSKTFRRQNRYKTKQFGFRRKIRITSYSNGKRCDNGGYNREKRCFYNHQERNTKKGQSERTERKFGTCEICSNASNATSDGFQRTMRENPKLFAEPFRNFPTQSPICSRDDGFSDRLDGIAFSKWRKESIKAYGNAIVPQVAYEIFKAIEQITNL